MLIIDWNLSSINKRSKFLTKNLFILKVILFYLELQRKYFLKDMDIEGRRIMIRANLTFADMANFDERKAKFEEKIK